MADPHSPLPVGAVVASPPSLALTPMVQVANVAAAAAEGWAPGTIRLSAASHPGGTARAGGGPPRSADTPAAGADPHGWSSAVPDLRGRIPFGTPAEPDASLEPGPYLPVTYMIAVGGLYPDGAVAPFIGMIAPCLGGDVPPNWMPADGRLLPVADYLPLFGLIGPLYGGDGISHFALPDLRGRAPVGSAAPTDPSETAMRVGDNGFAVYYVICTDGPLVGWDGDGALLPNESLFLGEVVASGAIAQTFEEAGVLPADGRLLPIAENDELYSLLGTAFGGDGTATFALPDLRGRSVVGAAP